MMSVLTKVWIAAIVGILGALVFIGPVGPWTYYAPGFPFGFAIGALMLGGILYGLGKRNGHKQGYWEGRRDQGEADKFLRGQPAQ
jgi:peptidoglycan/LPS O-acetylase OafA/YrhL